MKKILHVVGRMNRAGQETFLMNVLRSADLTKYDISFSVNTDYIGAYEQEIVELGGSIFHNPYPAKLRYLVPYLREFRKYIRNNGPFDIVHCHVYYFGGLIMWAAAKEEVPIRIMHSHNTNDARRDSFYRHFYRKMMSKFIRRYSTHLVACGQEAYQALFSLPCPSETAIINNAISLDKFKKEGNERFDLEDELGRPLTGSVFISVARFYKVKNHVKIIDVFDYYLKYYDSSAVLLLVGTGELFDDIKEYTINKGIVDSVFFLGSRDDVPRLLLASDLFLMPSLFEGLPVSLVEAQAAGTRCLISSTITKEVDMGIGILEYEHLDNDSSIWAEHCYRLLMKESVDYDRRKMMISNRGYSLDSVWRKLTNLYESKE